MLKLLLASFAVILLLSFQQQPKNPEQVIFDRIEYIYNLKTLIGEGAWNAFSDKKFDLPLIYYTDSTCYVANPTEKFLAPYKPNLVFDKTVLKIFKTKRLDTISFHMETGLTFGTGSRSAYNHRSPFMNCSSFEITRKTIPDVSSTEQWATMVIHEYFHGFQFKHPEHMAHFEKKIAVSSDTLKQLYKSHAWFKERVDKENELLLDALNSPDDKQVKKLIDLFFQTRQERRLQTKAQLSYDILPVEQSYETMEGTARYVEYSLYSAFQKKNPSKSLLESDSSYHAYRYFQNYNIEKDQWLYLTDNTNYFYATGFNLVRLLEKLKINYKARLFNEGGLSLDEILKQHFGSH